MGDADAARLRRQTIVAALAVVLGIAGAGAAVWARRPRSEPIEIGQQTTYITTPTRPDGWVDYAEAVDWMRRASLDAGGTNAAPLLVGAFGPNVLQAGVDRQPLLARIGAPRGDAWSLPPGLRERCRTRQNSKAAIEQILRWAGPSEPLLAILREASGAKVLYVPVPRDAGAHDLSRAGPGAAEAADALGCGAQAKLLRDNPSASWADVEAMWKLGALIAHSATPAEYALAGTFWKLAMDATVGIAPHRATGTELLAAMTAALRARPGFPPAAETLAILRLQTLHTVATPLVTSGASGVPMAPVGTTARLEAINRQFDALDAALQVADPKQRLARMDQASAAAGEAGGPARGALAGELAATTYQRLAVVALAVEKRRRETGKLPAGLVELGELPRDPASGASFSYAPNGETFRLYGAGADGRDDGGAGDKDIVVEVPASSSTAAP